HYADRYDYHNLAAKCAYAAAEYETALHHLREAEQLIRVMQPDGTEKTAQRIATLPEKLQMQGSCHLLLGRQEEALAAYEQALTIAPHNGEVLTHMGRLLCQLGHMERAAQIFEQLTAVMPGSYHGFFLLSQTLFDLRRDRDAFDAINRALELEGGDLGVYVLKMRILLRNGVWDAVRETVDFLHQHGVTDDINVLWCQAQVTEFADSDKEQALALYRQIAQRVESGERMEDAAALYFRLLVLEAEQLDAREKADRAKMLAIAEKGLSWKADDLPLLDYKAWLLKRDGQREAALELYHRLEQFQSHPLSVEQELAELYYKDLDADAHKARHYYQLLLQNEETAARHFYLGTCCK
ncbi:MAG: tetratricopeptide repeat protein, partial [Oscillospiraceae bacterium]|nr:tetratricopeptide repeat protein [Oscillospiraceae bacterium]